MLSTYSPSERDTDPEVGAVRLGQAEIETEFTAVLTLNAPIATKVVCFFLSAEMFKKPLRL